MSGIETFLQNIDGLTPLTVALVLLAGLIVGIAPSSFPLIAVATGLGAGEGTSATDNARMRGFCLSPGFALGIVTVDVILGGLFGLAGFAVLRLLTSALAYVYGLLALMLALTALALWRVIHIVIPMLRPSAGSASTFFGAYALGLPFGLSTRYSPIVAGSHASLSKGASRLWISHRLCLQNADRRSSARRPLPRRVHQRGYPGTPSGKPA